MLHLDLAEEERQILTDLREENIGALRMEIADTDRADYRSMLKKLLAALGAVSDA